MNLKSFLKERRRAFYINWFHGDTLTCPLCEHHFSRFLSGGSHSPEMARLGAIGIGRRKNVHGPFCSSNDRARLLLLYLKTTECFSGKPLKVLEIAPDRPLTKMLLGIPTLEYVCGSLFPEDYADLHALKVDVAAIPFEDNSFDVILCNHVLQQVPNDRLAMRELARVLRPTGWGIVQSPTANGIQDTFEDSTIVDERERRQRFGSINHLRLYGRDYARRLTEEGLVATPSHPIRDGWCVNAASYGVNPNEEVFVVRKR